MLDHDFEFDGGDVRFEVLLSLHFLPLDFNLNGLRGAYNQRKTACARRLLNCDPLGDPREHGELLLEALLLDVRARGLHVLFLTYIFGFNQMQTKSSSPQRLPNLAYTRDK